MESVILREKDLTGNREDADEKAYSDAYAYRPRATGAFTPSSVLSGNLSLKHDTTRSRFIVRRMKGAIGHTRILYGYSLTVNRNLAVNC